MENYDKLTDEEFDEILVKLIEDTPARELIQIPGVYEAVSEYFNNDVLDIWAGIQYDKVMKWDHEDVRELKRLMDIAEIEYEMTDLPSEEIPDDVDTLYPIWAMDKKGYCLVGDGADQIEHIDEIREWYKQKVE